MERHRCDERPIRVELPDESVLEFPSMNKAAKYFKIQYGQLQRALKSEKPVRYGPRKGMIFTYITK